MAGLGFVYWELIGSLAIAVVSCEWQVASPLFQ